ncbi:MAG: hypothetical protein U5S82_04795 [Gammaproteobacteria bacterium]|nr:hypothetical protein [Gammaproteobacteria bacterium]
MTFTRTALTLLIAAAITGCNANSAPKEAPKATRTDAAHTQASVSFDKPGYVTEVHDGRLWVFEADSKAYKDFKTTGEPSKIVTRIAAGPNGMTVRSTDGAVIDGYLLSKPGYVAEVHDGRLWVFEADSKAYKDFKTTGEPSKIVTRIAAGPNGMTVRSTEGAIIDGYLLSKPGYVAEVHDGRLWVFEANSKAYKDFKTTGEPSKIVTRIGAGPNGMTIRSTEAEVIDGYLAAKG